MFSGQHERARLERRPEATTQQVDDLLAKMQQGQLRLPEFQRGLKWLPRDMIELFDSMYRGIPVGTLLLWKRPAPDGPVTFGDFRVEAAARPDAHWIVDGQQRITTLATNLLVRRAPKQRALLFDLEDERFSFGPVPGDEAVRLPGMDGEARRAVPVQELFDSARAIAWMAKRHGALADEHVRRALECGKRLREYVIPAYVVDTDDEQVLREIFRRVNRSGRRLDETDVFTALFSTTGSEGERLDLGHVSRRVARLGFGLIHENSILQALRAVAGLPLDKDYTRELTRDRARQAIVDVQAGLERAVGFLRDIGLPHTALVPYELIFVVLARFFHLHPEPSIRNALLLRRWVWRGSLAGKLAGASASLRQHVDAIDDDEASSVQRLLALGAHEPTAPPAVEVDFGVFRLDRAKSALAACALASLKPRHLATGELLDVAEVFEDEPKRPLPEVIGDADAAGLSRSVANRLLHPPMAIRDVQRAILEAEASVLLSHGVPPEAREALARGDDASFLDTRAQFLKEHLGAYFRRQVEYGADDSPAIDALTTDEES